MLTTSFFCVFIYLFPLFTVLYGKYVAFGEENTKRVNTTKIDIGEYCPWAPGCMIPGMHILCLDQLSDFGPDCDLAKEIVITPDIAVRILTLFNLMRSRLAKGLEKLRDKHVPKAYGMNLLHWDSELATFAQLWAKQCQLGTDACHGSARFPLSSQLRMDVRFDEDWNDIHDNKHYNFSHNFNDILMKVLSNVYAGKDKLDLNELFECKTQCIGEPRFDDPTEFNAYPYVINSDSTHVGCGMATFVKRFHADSRKHRIQKIVSLICNFSHPLKVDDAICNFTAPTTSEYTNCGCAPDKVETKECLCTVLKGRCSGIGCLPPVLLLPIFSAEPAGQSKKKTDAALRIRALKHVQKSPSAAPSISMSSLVSVEPPEKGDQSTSITEQPEKPKLEPTLLDKENSEKRTSLGKSLSGHGPELEELSQNDEVQRPPRFSKHGFKNGPVQTPPKTTNSLDLSWRKTSKNKKRRSSSNTNGKLEDVPARKNYDVVQKIFNKYMQAKRQTYKENPYVKLINGGNFTDANPSQDLEDVENHEQLITFIPHENTYSHPLKQSLIDMIDKFEKQLGSVHLTNEVREILNKKINGIYHILSNKHTNTLQGNDINNEQDDNKHKKYVLPKLSHVTKALANHQDMDYIFKHKLGVIDTNKRGKAVLLPEKNLRKEVDVEETSTKLPRLVHIHHNHNNMNNLAKYGHLINLSPRNQMKSNHYEKTHETYDHELGFKRMRPVKAVATKSVPKLSRIQNTSNKRPIISNEKERNRYYEEIEDDDKDERSLEVERHPSRLKRTDSEDSSEDRRRDYYEERDERKLYK